MEGRLTRWRPRLGDPPRAVHDGSGRAVAGPAVDEPTAGRHRDRTGAIGAAAGFLYLAAVLGLPGVWLSSESFPRLPIEALALAAILPAVRIFEPRLRRRLLRALALAVLALFSLALVDALLDRTFGRALDIPLDIHLAPALLDFMGDALGLRELSLWLGGSVLVAALVYWSSLIALRAMAEASGATIAVWGVATIILAASAGLATTAGRDPGKACLPSLPLSCHASQVVARQVESASALWRPLPEFDRAVASDPLAELHGEILARLRSTDVLIVFVESYGTAALQDPRYASSILPRLEAMGADLSAAGLSVASGRLQAPTVGGLSWLSHGTLLSGIWLDNQRLYERLLTSERRTLVHMFAEAGHRTIGLFPQILQPWPESAYFGYDRIWTSRNIDYAGPSFGWTTMPDQYTLWFLQREERSGPADRPPLFAEIALISSHAPWEPVPTLLDDWRGLGRGESFVGMADPAWKGPEHWPEKAPENYARTLTYSLDSVAGFARRFADADTLMIVLGDHQPAPLITGATEDRSVPMHVIAGDPALVAPFLEWGFRESVLPDLSGTAKGMDAFRSWFVKAFSEAERALSVSQRGE